MDIDEVMYYVQSLFSKKFIPIDIFWNIVSGFSLPLISQRQKFEEPQILFIPPTTDFVLLSDAEMHFYLDTYVFIHALYVYLISQYLSCYLHYTFRL